MSNQEPTPDAPAEVCERLKQALQWLNKMQSVQFERDDIAMAAIYKTLADDFTSALSLISQGEKERERVAATINGLMDECSKHISLSNDFPWEEEIYCAFRALAMDGKQVRSYLKALGVNLTDLFKKWDGRAPEELTEEICFLATCAECDAQTNAEVKAYLLAHGYTQERLDAGLARIRQTIEKAIDAARAQPTPESK